MSVTRPLTETFPRLASRVRFEALGVFPTPVESLDAIRTGGAPLFAKRDDRSSPLYGGNKVRTLEVLFGEALRAGSTRIYSTGAYGTNHGLATVLHAPRVGLEPGVILFPQPVSDSALVNLRATLALRPDVVALPHWSALPFGMLATRARAASAERPTTIMLPGGATPMGGLGYVNAALELASQITRGELPVPETIVVGVGSNCTSAGLLVGLRVAAKLGLGFRKPPQIRSIRVTPWPVTSKLRIVALAVDVARALADFAGDASLAFDRAELASGLTVDGSELGWGYGYETKHGRSAMRRFHDDLGWELDSTYSAKAVAGALATARHSKGPVLYWSTKSTSPLAPVRDTDLALAPASMRRWMDRAASSLARRARSEAGA